MRRAALLIIASAIAMLGWGTVLPYQYAYAASTRDWGGMAGAAASSLFSVGALLAAPLGGRLADRYSPVLIAIMARVVAAVAAFSLIIADDPVSFLIGMAAFGFGLSGGSPAQSVLALRWAPGAGDRRKVFAWIASGQALGMGIGSFAAGFLVHLDRTDGMLPAFLMAGGGFAVSGLLITIAARGDRVLTPRVPAGDELAAGPRQTVSMIISSRPLLLTAVISIALALAYNAQFESGLPAYGLAVLGIGERLVGIAAALNCAVILALQIVVIRWTARRSAAVLLMIVGGFWVLAWTLLGLAAGLSELAPMIFLSTFGIFALGETLFAPVLNPLIAGLAPEGMAGSTLGIFTALQTGASTLGPLISGITLGAGLSSVFIIANIVISLAAVIAAVRLRAALAAARQPALVPAAAQA
ncbi:MAG: MFS transporter [Microlunatus sp.]|nr:MFS transporter [Microlunatus sp.]